MTDTKTAMAAAVARKRGAKPGTPMSTAQRKAKSNRDLIERGGWRGTLAIEKDAHEAMRALQECLDCNARAAVEVALLFSAARLATVKREAKAKA